MKPLLVTLAIFPLLAQTPPPADPAKTQTDAPPESPKPQPEAQLTGFLEVGYRWRTDVAGSLDAYRSIVDLGSGPKLLRTEFALENPSRKLFDRIDARAYNWGDDPYSTLNVSVRKQRVYDFSADYRNLAYFNALPSFADPLLSRGVLLNERSFDIRRRNSSYRLEFLPANKIVPYLAYERSSGYGRGVNTFVSDANEYPVPTRLNDQMNNYHGGLRFELPNAHATVEQGGTTMKDDQELFEGPGTRNLGNRETPFSGQTLFLGNLLQAYGIRGSSIYTKALGNVSASQWLRFSGEFLYSRPQIDTNYQQFNSGNFALTSQALLFSAQEHLVSSQARMPHKTGTVAVEALLHRRARLLVSWLTDRLDNSGTSNGRQTFSAASVVRLDDPTRTGYLQNEYNQVAGDLVFDVWRSLTLRTGYRYVWGKAQTLVMPEEGLQSVQAGALRRNVVSGGFSFRPFAKLSVNGDAEGAASGRTYFRTSLHDYQRAGFRLRYQITGSLNLAADYRILTNQNPTAGINYDLRSQQTSLVFGWTPAGGKRVNIQADYTRSTFRSDITYLLPQTLQRDRSFYQDNGHSAGLLVDFVLPGYSGSTPTLSAGGSLLRTSGSRPTTYYRPLARLSLPVTKSVAWVSEWKYHGFNEALYAYEAFRTHLIETGIRLTR
jgi:hypothetical protein